MKSGTPTFWHVKSACRIRLTTTWSVAVCGELFCAERIPTPARVMNIDANGWSTSWGNCRGCLLSSIKQRLDEPAAPEVLPPLLLPFASQGKPEELPYAFTDYLMLVDWTGRAIRPDKRGHIPAQLGPILERLGLDGVLWLKQVVLFRRQGIRVVGGRDQCQQFARHCGQWRCHQPRI